MTPNPILVGAGVPHMRLEHGGTALVLVDHGGSCTIMLGDDPSHPRFFFIEPAEALKLSEFLHGCAIGGAH